jgi:hypothetical protein
VKRKYNNFKKFFKTKEEIALAAKYESQYLEIESKEEKAQFILKIYKMIDERNVNG